MKQTFFLNIIISLLFTFSIANAQNKRLAIPNNWQKIEACGGSFYAPLDLVEENSSGIDFCGWLYRGHNLLITVGKTIIGGYESDSLKNQYSEKKDFQIAQTRIDGRKAEILTFYETSKAEQLKDLPYSVILFVPVAHKPGGDSLTMTVNTQSAEEREMAKKIFETINFDK